MKFCAPALAVLLLASAPALAGGRSYTDVPYATTWKNSCAQIQGLVARNGAAVLTFAQRGYDPSSLLSAVATVGASTYDRVAHDARYCLPRSTLTPIWVPTRDNPQCFAGYTCSEDGAGRGRHGR